MSAFGVEVYICEVKIKIEDVEKKFTLTFQKPEESKSGQDSTPPFISPLKEWLEKRYKNNASEDKRKWDYIESYINRYMHGKGYVRQSDAQPADIQRWWCKQIHFAILMDGYKLVTGAEQKKQFGNKPPPDEYDSNKVIEQICSLHSQKEQYARDVMISTLKKIRKPKKPYSYRRGDLDFFFDGKDFYLVNKKSVKEYVTDLVTADKEAWKKWDEKYEGGKAAAKQILGLTKNPTVFKEEEKSDIEFKQRIWKADKGKIQVTCSQRNVMPIDQENQHCVLSLVKVSYENGKLVYEPNSMDFVIEIRYWNDARTSLEKSFLSKVITRKIKALSDKSEVEYPEVKNQTDVIIFKTLTGQHFAILRHTMEFPVETLRKYLKSRITFEEDPDVKAVLEAETARREAELTAILVTDAQKKALFYARGRRFEDLNKKREKDTST